MALILVQLLNGISLGMIYVLMAVGLTIVFGMLNIINFAHGAVYAVGAYLAFSFSVLLGQWVGSFWISIILAPIFTAAFGARDRGDPPQADAGCRTRVSDPAHLRRSP